MRVYHLLPEAHALDDLRRRRLKVSRLDDMNDPFELLTVSLKDKQHRAALRRFKADLDRPWGALCFSRRWRHPMLWSHYADKHRGICLGFDVPEKRAVRVAYTSKRIEFDIERQLAKGTRDKKLGLKLLTTKYEGWKYEDEVRFIVSLDEPDSHTGMYFCAFGRQLALKEVILGVRSTLSRGDVTAELSESDRHATIVKARLAFRSFSVVRQRNARLSSGQGVG